MDTGDTDFDIRWFDTLESTNNYCKLLDLNAVGEFTVIAAHCQTAGIGQQGNHWESQPGQNLTFSLILKPTFLAAQDQYSLTMALSVAVAETVEQALSAFRFPLSAQIKWPNDIYVGDRKICGTLITSQISGSRLSHSICGIGLNVNQTRFPDWVPNPTSLSLLTGSEHNLDTLLNTLLSNIETEYNRLKDNDSSLRSRYLSRLYRIETPAAYIYQGRTIRATITGIDNYGHLQLLADDGEQLTCGMKEVRFVI